ncbi:hypothetical protein ACFXOQ_37300, partial [Streptomyces californicus]
GDGQLVADLIDSRCAGTALDVESVIEPRSATLEFELLDPPASDDSAPALHLGTALADIAAAAGIRVAPPPRLSDRGRILLSDHISHAEQRYGRLIRDHRVIAL